VESKLFSLICFLERRGDNMALVLLSEKALRPIESDGKTTRLALTEAVTGRSGWPSARLIEGRFSHPTEGWKMQVMISSWPQIC
jgi:hypothetical protein